MTTIYLCHRMKSISLSLLIALTSLGATSALAGGGEMGMPMGQAPAATTPMPATDPQPPCAGGMKPGMDMMGMMGMMDKGMMKMDGMGGNPGGAAAPAGMPNMAPAGTPPDGASVPKAATNTSPSVASANTPTSTRLHHLGSVDFFLDQGTKLSLTDKQTNDLQEIKRKAIARTDSLQSKITQSEQQLFALTGATTPNQTSISKKVKEIESLRSEQRLDFIRSVGSAVKVLNIAQRNTIAAN